MGGRAEAGRELAVDSFVKKLFHSWYLPWKAAAGLGGGKVDARQHRRFPLMMATAPQISGFRKDPAQAPASLAPSFDARGFRDTLGRFATGVAVVTAPGDDGALGVTISSFNSVSLTPPLVLFSIDRRAYSLGAMLAAKGYGINILGGQQEALSKRFAKALTDKWHDVAHVCGYAEAPLLVGALAHFECRPYAQHDGGDHVIFIAEVVNFAVAHSDEESPLIFFRGQYRSLLADGHCPGHFEWPSPIHYF